MYSVCLPACVVRHTVVLFDYECGDALQLTGLTDITVNGAIVDTVYTVSGASDDVTPAIHFGVEFNDGTCFRRQQLFSTFSSEFRSALVAYSSTDPDTISVDTDGGCVTELHCSVWNIPAVCRLCDSVNHSEKVYGMYVCVTNFAKHNENHRPKAYL